MSAVIAGIGVLVCVALVVVIVFAFLGLSIPGTRRWERKK